MRVVKFPQALVDLVEMADYFANNDLELADRFFDAFESTIDTLRRTPKIGSLRVQKDGSMIRMWFIQGFTKCLIFYSESEGEVVILRLIHSSRDYTRFFSEE